MASKCLKYTALSNLANMQYDLPLQLSDVRAV
jgi:hypothetical protein